MCVSRAGPIHTWQPRVCQFILTSSSSMPWLSPCSCKNGCQAAAPQLLDSTCNSRVLFAERANERKVNRGADPSFLLLGGISPTGCADVSCRAAEPTAEDHIFTAECGKFRVCCWSGRRQHRRAQTKHERRRVTTVHGKTNKSVKRLHCNEIKHSCRNSWVCPKLILHCLFVRLHQAELVSELFYIYWICSDISAINVQLSASQKLFSLPFFLSFFKLAAAMRRQTEEAWGNSIVKLRRKRKSSCLWILQTQLP